MSIRLIILISVVSMLSACQPTALEEFQLEGGALSRALLQDLRKVETREDLVFLEPILKKDFNNLVNLMIQARAFQQKNLDFEIPIQNANQILNASLVEEMKRIYDIEGGRECIERAQREAMLKLHAREKMFEKQQKSIHVR